MLSPGSYLRLRREAAGQTVQSAAAQLATLSIAVGGTQPTRAAILEAVLLRVEGNLAILRAAEARIVARAFNFDTRVYEELAMIQAAGPGSNLPVPQVCHACGCSWFDPCVDGAESCGWSDHNPNLCTHCDAVIEAPYPAATAHRATRPTGRVVGL